MKFKIGDKVKLRNNIIKRAGVITKRNSCRSRFCYDWEITYYDFDEFGDIHLPVTEEDIIYA